MVRRTLLAAVMGMALGCETPNAHDARAQNSAREKNTRVAADRSAFDTDNEPTVNARTRYAAGQLAEEQGQPEKALEQYQSALRIDPRHAGALYRMGVIYTVLKRYPEAIATWNKYVAITGSSAAGYGNLGLTYEAAGNFTEAEAAYRAGIEKDPTAESVRTNYAMMLIRQGKTREAETQLSAVLKPAEVHYDIGRALEQEGKREAAAAEYRKALAADAEFRDARVRLRAVQ